MAVPSFRVVVKVKWINTYPSANKSAQPTESSQWRVKRSWFSPPLFLPIQYSPFLIKGGTIHSVVQARSPSHPWLFSFHLQSFSKTHWLPLNCVPYLSNSPTAAIPLSLVCSWEIIHPYNQWYHTTGMAIFFKIYIKLHHSLLQYCTMLHSKSNSNSLSLLFFFQNFIPLLL